MREGLGGGEAAYEGDERLLEEEEAGQRVIFRNIQGKGHFCLFTKLGHTISRNHALMAENDQIETIS